MSRPCADPWLAWLRIQMIPMDEIDTAHDRMVKSDARYRFVIDMATVPVVG